MALSYSNLKMGKLDETPQKNNPYSFSFCSNLPHKFPGLVCINVDIKFSEGKIETDIIEVVDIQQYLDFQQLSSKQH